MYIYNVVIKDIIDGDTVKVDLDLGFELWLNDQNIRLYGIDTPETRTTDLIEKKFGLLAKSTVEKFLPIGSKQQMVSVIAIRGKFGRILGEFLADDPERPGHKFNLNRYLVEKRLAVPYKDGSRDQLREMHHKNRMFLMKMGLVE